MPNKITIALKPVWMPVTLWHSVKGLSSCLTLPSNIKKATRKRRLIPVSDWAEWHRPVIVGPLSGTRYKKETVPYANGIMDASFYSTVEEIVLCCADQTSKSFIIETCIGYLADRAPGPVAYTYPDEDTTKDNFKDRLLPLFRESPRLKSYLTGAKDDESLKRLDLQHMSIYATWATSATKLANKSIKYLVADEVDKYPATGGTKEGTTLDKLRNRYRTYRYGRKIWISSTPTIESGAIWVELNNCNIVFAYYVSCPDCGQIQTMEFTQIKWTEGEKSPEKIFSDKDSTHYVCKFCGSCWDDSKRNAAVRKGEWRAMDKSPDGKREYVDPGMVLFEYLKKHKPRKIGFHIPSWISQFVDLREAAAAFLAGLKDKNKLKHFNNSHAARPWTDFTQERQEDKILELRDDRPRGMVPGGQGAEGEHRLVSALTAFVDTQGSDERGGFWYEIRAWGWPDENMDMESWQIREGYLASFAAIEEVMWGTEYKDIAGNEYKVAIVLQDAMGRRTDEVYRFCKRHPGRIIPTQGVDTRRMSAPHSWTNLDMFPGSKKPIPGGLKLLRFDANYYKNILAGKLEINPEDPGAWRLHSETTEEWARMLCSETIDPEKMIWVLIGSMENHGWDCSVGNILAAEVLGIKYAKPPASRAQGAGRRAQREGKGGFIPKKEGWLKK